MLFIKVINGGTVDHPVLGGNLAEVFRGLPDNYEPFVRTEKPPLGLYEVDDPNVPQYGRNEDGVWTDLWPRRPMNAEERAVKEAEVLADRLRIQSSVARHMGEKLAELTDAEAIATVEAYKQELEQLQITADEDFTFPMPPAIINGKLAPALTNPGSAPEVIG